MQPEQLPAERPLGAQIFLSPGEQRLRTGWRLAIQLLLFILALLIFTVPFSLLVLLPVDWLSPIIGEMTGNMEFLVGAIPGLLATFASVLFARRLLDHRSIASLGISLSRSALWDLLSGFFIAGPMIGSIFLIEWGVGWLAIDSFAWQKISLSSIFLQASFLFIALVLAGFAEELQFRGYWLVNLSEGLNLRWAAIISSFAFALAHLANPGISPAALGGLLLAGLFFVFAVQRTRTIWLATGLHIGWNFFLGPVFGFQISGLEAFHLIGQEVQGPVYWTGGAFGPEAGLVLLPALGIGWLLVMLYTQNRSPGS
jgi:membrane protease YdiL (CAAX protease family)